MISRQVKLLFGMWSRATQNIDTSIYVDGKDYTAKSVAKLEKWLGEHLLTNHSDTKTEVSLR